MEIFLENAQQDFINFLNNNGMYQNMINDLSQNFGINFLPDVLPSYYSGDFYNGNEKFVVIGINPGFNQGNNDFENEHRTEDWDSYRNFHDNFFEMYQQQGNMRIPYYSYIAGVLAPDDLRFAGDWNYYNYCQNSILNIDIIPYHSHNFRNANLNEEMKDYIWDRFNNQIIPLLVRNSENISQVIIHGASLFKILSENNFFTQEDLFYNQNNRGHRMIFSPIHPEIHFKIFSRFIPYGGFSRASVQDHL